MENTEKEIDAAIRFLKSERMKVIHLTHNNNTRKHEIEFKSKSGNRYFINNLTSASLDRLGNLSYNNEIVTRFHAYDCMTCLHIHPTD